MANPGRGTALALCFGLVLFPWYPPSAEAMSAEEVEADWGFLYSRERSLSGTLHSQALGPFLEWSPEDEGDQYLALRPLFSQARDVDTDRLNREALWPLYMTREVRGGFSGRYLILSLYVNHDVDDPESPYRFWIIPFVFRGQGLNGEPYSALFPIGGSIRNFLLQDQIEFVFFPIWMRTRLNDIETRHWVWPIYKRGGGEGVYHVRVFPFHGRSIRHDDHARRYAFWPFWTWAESYRSGTEGKGYIFFPFWGHVNRAHERTFFLVPPFFRVSKGARVTTMHLPYPLVQVSRGEIQKTYLWPLWGEKSMPGTWSSFFLWPICYQQRVDKGNTVFHRALILPFVHSFRYEIPPETDAGSPEIIRSHFKLWPLFGYQRDGDRSRFRTLALWPLKDTAAVERSYAPFWSLYERRRQGDATRSELLWGLARHHRTGDEERYVSVFPFFQYHRADAAAENCSFSILKGLVGYERREGRAQVRLLYAFRFGQKDHQP